MIGREIEPETDRWPKCADRFQLKRAHFDGEQVELLLFARDFRERFADVAASDGALAARIQHLRKQFGRRRFSVRARNGDDRRVAELPAQFELADGVDLAREKISGQRRCRIDARTQHGKFVS